MEIQFKSVIPILRIFDLEKARRFYLGFLGFTENWLHRFDETAPAYLEVERAGMKLHLSEHHGDCCPGATVFVWMTGIHAFHQEILATNYSNNRPGIERAFYDAWCVEVIDPFGNRIRFNEEIASPASVKD